MNLGDVRTITVTGADGFIGKTLCVRLAELGRFRVVPIVRASGDEALRDAVVEADVLFHLAGSNRPADPAEFMAVNRDVTAAVANAVTKRDRPLRIVYASSAKAEEATPYGTSKRAAEEILQRLAASGAAAVHIFRLPNVFGKWCRPDYNSAVATFCHNIARDLPIRVDDPAAPLSLAYVDDVVDAFLALIDPSPAQSGFEMVSPIYETTVGAVAQIIRGFRAERVDNRIADVGDGLLRALYATYVSSLPTADFSYEIASHRDPRGAFSEMLKTTRAGQFSYFTAHPGVTRGGHYHHTKTEKFLIVHGAARFRFRHILTGETHEISTNAEVPIVVETIPGWSHDVTNIGDGVMVSLLWANEIFDRARPDTIAAKV